ncbi:ATP-binding protein, partial [Nostoc sp. NIES-2111]
MSDSGIGIAPDDAARIFDEFEQVDGRLQGRQKGTGLGLPLSRKLAELLGGGLSVESEPGTGSTFRLRIPVRFGDGPGGSARSLLVIDDHEPFRYVVRQAALANGVTRVLEAADGGEGLAVARAELPDLVVLDLQMPGMDGEAVLRELRRDTVLAGVPVVVLTSQPITPELRRRLDGARAVVSKDDLTRSLLGELLVLRNA